MKSHANFIRFHSRKNAFEHAVCEMAVILSICYYSSHSKITCSDMTIYIFSITYRQIILNRCTRFSVNLCRLFHSLWQIWYCRNVLYALVFSVPSFYVHISCLWGWWFETQSHPLWRRYNDIFSNQLSVKCMSLSNFVFIMLCTFSWIWIQID